MLPVELLTPILAAPDDDRPRLIAADWLGSFSPGIRPLMEDDDERHHSARHERPGNERTR